MILSSFKKYLHPYGKAESSNIMEVLHLILDIDFLRIVSVKKDIGLASAKFPLKDISQLTK